MRCLALAEQWANLDGKVEFVSSCTIDALIHRIIELGFQFVPLNKPHPSPDDLDLTLERIRALDPEWVVLDGYPFDTAYQEAIKSNGNSKLLVIDDTAKHSLYHADVYLNQNLHATELDCRCDPQTVKLLGPRYALLRSQFARWNNWERKVPVRVERLFVTLGGASDSADYRKIVEVLEKIKPIPFECDIVIGSTCLSAALEERILRLGSNVRIHAFMDDVSNLMAVSDLAISSSGSTTWEMACMGLPLLLTTLSENQEPVASTFESLGAAINLGRLATLDRSSAAAVLQEVMLDSVRRRQMSMRLRELVDGKGVERVISRLREL
jgi:UDP-2,4-diacetamido-2,4,6-trideoxy-beta-L-altropyranose hydrolase